MSLLLPYLQECAISLVIDARLDEDPVGADAGLAGVAELGGHAAGDGLRHVGRVEDDEGRVAAQLKRDLLHRAGALPGSWTSQFSTHISLPSPN